MKTYYGHKCENPHATTTEFMRCAVRGSAFVIGTGQFALITRCRFSAVALYPTLSEAEDKKALIDFEGCGNGCRDRHEIVRVDPEDTRR